MTHLKPLMFALSAALAFSPVSRAQQSTTPPPRQQLEHARGARGSRSLLNLHELVSDTKHSEYLDGEIIIFLPNWMARVAFKDGHTRAVPTDELEPATIQDGEDDDADTSSAAAPAADQTEPEVAQPGAVAAPSTATPSDAPTAAVATDTQPAPVASVKGKSNGPAYLIFADTASDGVNALTLAHTAFDQLYKQRRSVDLVVAGVDDAKSPLQICDHDSPSGTCVLSHLNDFTPKMRSLIWEEIGHRTEENPAVATNRLDLLMGVLPPFVQRYDGRPETVVYLGSGNGFRALRIWARPGADKSAVNSPALSPSEGEIRTLSVAKHINVLALKSAPELSALGTMKGAPVPVSKAYVIFADAAADPTSVDRAHETLDLILKQHPNSFVDLMIATEADTKTCQWCDSTQPGVYSVVGISEISAVDRDQTWKEAQNFKGPASASADRLARLADALGRYEKDKTERGVLYLGGGESFHAVRNWSRPYWAKPRLAAAPAVLNPAESRLRDLATSAHLHLAALTSVDELGASFTQRAHASAGSESYLIFADALVGGQRALRRAQTSVASIMQRQPGAKIDLVIAGAGKSPELCNWCDANGTVGTFTVTSVSDLSKFNWDATWREVNTFASTVAATAPKDAPTRGTVLEATIQGYADRYKTRDRQILYFGDGDYFKQLRAWASPEKEAPKTLPAPANATESQIRDLLKTNKMHLYAMNAPVPAVARTAARGGGNTVAVLLYANLDHAFMPIAALRQDVATLLVAGRNTTFDLAVELSNGSITKLDDIGNMSREQLAGAFADLERAQNAIHDTMARTFLSTNLPVGGDGTLTGFSTTLHSFASQHEGLIRGAIFFSGGAPVTQTQMGYGTMDSPTLRQPYIVHQTYGPQDQETAREVSEFARDESLVINTVQLGRQAAINVEAYCWDALLQNFMIPGSGSLLSQMANATGGTFRVLSFPDAPGPSGHIIADGTVSQLSDTVKNLAMNVEGQPGNLRLDQGVADFVGRQHDAISAWLRSSNFVSPTAKLEMDVVAAPQRPLSLDLKVVDPTPEQ